MSVRLELMVIFPRSSNFLVDRVSYASYLLHHRFICRTARFGAKADATKKHGVNAFRQDWEIGDTKWQYLILPSCSLLRMKE